MVAPQRLISVCNEADFEVWQVAYTQIKKHVRPDQVWVIVPDAAASMFEEISDANDLVVPESKLSGGFFEQLRDHLACIGQSKRLGWYLQQFLKLAALRESSDLERVLLWDADTVAVRRLPFFSKGGSVIVYPSHEYHLPYFRAIDALLGLDRVVDFSFVSQCFPITGSAIRMFWDHVEQHSEKDFWEAVVSAIQWDEGAGFSEYETLGTFLTHAFPELIKQSPRFWARNGWHYFQNPSDATRIFPKFLYPSFVSFEKWQNNSVRKPALWIIGQPLHWALRKRLSGRVSPSLARILRNIYPRDNVSGPRKLRGTKAPERVSLDKFLETLFSKSSDLWVVQVGANDGLQNDPLRPFLTKAGNYQATLVEPNPLFYEDLDKLYAGRTDVKTFQIAAGSSYTKETLYYVPKDLAIEMNGNGPLNNWAFGIGSESRANVVYWIHKNGFRGSKYRQKIRNFIDGIREIEIDVVPTCQLLPEELDLCLLLIDVEGFEHEVIAGLDPSNLPRWVVIEENLSDFRARQMLESLGYDVMIDGHDSVFELQ